MSPRQFLSSRLLLVFAGLLIAGPLAAQTKCDTTLTNLATETNGYRLRGNRCEGMLGQQQGGTTLLLVSFTEVFQPYASEHDTMRVSWPSDVRDSVRLRAEFLRRGPTQYRMDATAPATSNFLWPAGLVSKLPGRNVGVVGWTRFSVLGSSTQLYLPLQIRITAGPVACGDYSVVLLPGVRLDSVFVTLAPLDAQGRRGPPVRDNQPLTSGPYSAEYPIPFRIRRQEIPEAGVYYLRIGGRLSDGRPATEEYYLSLSPPCQG